MPPSSQEVPENCFRSSIMNLFRLLLSSLAFISPTYVKANDSYPQTALQCYASSALQSQKDGIIICPADRQNYCIKEVINATSRGDCGTVEGIYYGRDVWDRKVSLYLSSFASREPDIIILTFIIYHNLVSTFKARSMCVQKVFSNLSFS